ncbi:Trm112 family protein [Geobacter sp. SVR]|uniref:Trm112 family protein n=1 Tax=Geobacter sp. SVR TaxID=2495594 RepID=UPI00143F0456|nr:Trm112 family protein [Geobacter sp. SVR]BCS52423.1 hypothetical protein GSVR_07310 [Geobacter sp. SVR]GCF87346.1 hypothetical protein GSbR_39460 [Geobacter sp. SVR]
MLSHDLFDILACPACKGDLARDDSKQVLYCQSCNLNFPVRDGIPVMLLEEAFPNGTAPETVTSLSSEDGRKVTPL